LLRKCNIPWKKRGLFESPLAVYDKERMIQMNISLNSNNIAVQEVGEHG
jgi:hypothetical protein